MAERSIEITTLLDQLPIFSDLTSTEITELSHYFRLKRWAANETIFSEGENSHDLFFIVVGAALIKKKDRTGMAKTIAKVDPKNVLGEAAFVDGSLRSATAVAAGDTIGLAMHQDSLESIGEHFPHLAIKLLKKLNRLLALKLRKTSREFADVVTSKTAELTPQPRPALPDVVEPKAP